MQVKNIAETIDVNGYIVDTCDCRLNQMNCNKRIDTCFKQNKKGKNLIKKFEDLSSEKLVRIYVHNGGFKTEICHCCNCCCIPMIIQNYYPTNLFYSSGHIPTIIFDSCTNCGLCKSTCPFSAIDEKLNIDKNKCFGCGLCWKNCSENAIEMIKFTRESVKIPNRFFSLIFCIIFLSYIFTLQKMYSKKESNYLSHS
jgi:Pyruvate/2-oxoacid:ferredoxin oxidoreductase delta subunit